MTTTAGLLGGLGLGLLSAAACNVGVAIQKRAALTLPSARGFRLATVRAFLAHRGWLGGNALTLSAWVLHAAALNLAPLTIVHPAMATGIPMLAVLAVRWFHERLGRLEWTGVAACTVGIALEALSVTPETDAAARATDWTGMAAVGGALLVASAAAARVARRAAPGTSQAEISRAIAAGALYAIVALLTKALTLALRDGAVVLTVALVAALVLLSVVALGILQAAYQQGRAIVVMTLTTVLADFSPVVLTMPVFHEPWPGGAAGWWRALACGFLAAGITMLARSAASVGPSTPAQLSPGTADAGAIS